MIILHGEDSAKSYERLSVIIDDRKSQSFEVIIHDSQELDITYLRQEVGSTGLFGSQKCFVIKNLLSSTKSKNKDKLLDVLAKSKDHEIIFWEGKALTATALKPFSEAKVENFPISPVIFKFLDSLRPGNSSQILLSWKKMLSEGVEPEFVSAMLARQVKLLILAKSGPGNLQMAPYPARLITAQAQHFSLNHLLTLYKLLYDIDVKIKTGISAASTDHLLTHFLQKI